jgi:molecular chaperone GrpE
MARDGGSTNKTEEQLTETEENEDPKGFSVSDRRHWARRQQGEELEEPTEPGERLPTYVEQLTAQMEQKDVTLKEYIAAHKKTKEEMEAARARMAQDMERRLERHKQEFLAGLLPVLDNLERAVAAGENHPDFDGLLKGITMVRDLFMQKLRDEGVERISAVGEPFNPEIHEAMSLMDVDTPEKDNKVVEELSPGYLYRDSLLRAVQVCVGQHRASSSKAEEDE